jgi:hypothetical protein
MNQRTIAPEEADLMIGRTWFSESPGPVLVYDQPISLPAFDAGSRAAEAKGPERVLFVHGLTVSGTAMFDGAPDSIYVVMGDLRVGRLELGNTTCAVSGRVVADEYVYSPSGAAVFAVGGDATSDDATTPALPPVFAPIVVWFEPRRGIDQVYVPLDKTLRRLSSEELPPPLARLYDASKERFTDAGQVRALLRSGGFR